MRAYCCRCVMRRLTAFERPDLTRAEALVYIAQFGNGEPESAVLVALRGFVGSKARTRRPNQFGIYDDVVALVTPTGCETFTANTDPSRSEPGVAELCPGRWLYRIGKHGGASGKSKPYTALVQAAEVDVFRPDGVPGPAAPPIGERGKSIGDGVWRGMLQINIHRGGKASTNSLGCQTIYPSQWSAFMKRVQLEMGRFRQAVIPYYLCDS